MARRRRSRLPRTRRISSAGNWYSEVFVIIHCCGMDLPPPAFPPSSEELRKKIQEVCEDIVDYGENGLDCYRNQVGIHELDDNRNFQTLFLRLHTSDKDVTTFVSIWHAA